MNADVKIISVSDVITNSSSEVFVLSDIGSIKSYENLEGFDECVDIREIDWYFILRYEYKMTVDLCGLDKSEIFTFVENENIKQNWWWDDVYNGKFGHWEEPNNSVWQVFCEKHKDKIQKVIDQDLYFVSIEDHFEDCRSVIDTALNESLWYESRH